ncbi:unnamed protein product [Caenorhabditis angaria]|uniref:Peptidase M14 domain-containing protein n=1 Tax=Caenorhabditis angaria TaxID=860376 RepID=A0A9P1MVP7_9PELO|nr:unnamed protein product [Caenorhabditis angaria]
MLLLLLIFSNFLPFISTTSDYTNYSLIRFQVDLTSNTLEKLEKFDSEFDEKSNSWKVLLDIWAEPSKSHPFVDVLVAPQFMRQFKSMLTSMEIGSLTILEEDIQKHISLERKTMLETNQLENKNRRKRRELGSNWKNFNTHMYHPYSNMIDFMTVLADQKPDMVEKFKVATSSQGRSIYGVRIHPPRKSNPEKPSIIIDAGVHAREWIAPGVALYIIKRLVEGYGNDDKITKNLDKFDWYIFPQVNPDGYEYSRTEDRLWRKTRSKNETVNRYCHGADANRNWGYRWGEVGANRTPCSNIYMGSHPYSEPEILGLKDYFTWQITNPMIYFSLHSYGQLFLSPWGYTNQRTDNHFDQQSAAREAVNAIKNTTGVIYKSGTISEMMYPASGTSIDYMQHLGVPYIYGVELRPNELAGSGFNLPESFIKETGDEMIAALQAISEHAVRVKKL